MYSLTTKEQNQQTILQITHTLDHHRNNFQRDKALFKTALRGIGRHLSPPNVECLQARLPRALQSLMGDITHRPAFPDYATRRALVDRIFTLGCRTRGGIFEIQGDAEAYLDSIIFFLKRYLAPEEWDLCFKKLNAVPHNSNYDYKLEGQSSFY